MCVFALCVVCYAVQKSRMCGFRVWLCVCYFCYPKVTNVYVLEVEVGVGGCVCVCKCVCVCVCARARRGGGWKCVFVCGCVSATHAIKKSRM